MADYKRIRKATGPMGDTYANWFEVYDEVTRLAHWLVENDYFEGCDDEMGELLLYFDKPWNWDNEYRVMIGDKFRCEECEEIFDHKWVNDGPGHQSKVEQTVCDDCRESHISG
jgi:hypothetical protein